jgi:UDP-3-O-[3-hydroxymyristoyl] glucosamine N-acyltransferase
MTEVYLGETYDEIFEGQRIPDCDRSPDNFFFDIGDDGLTYAIPTHVGYDGKTYRHLENGAIVSPNASSVNYDEIGSRVIIMDADLGLSSIGDGTEVASGVSIGEDCYIGENNFIGMRTSIGRHCLTGDDVTIGTDNWVQSFVAMGNDVTISKDSTLSRGSYIGNNVSIGAECQIGNNADIGDGSMIFDRTKISPRTIIRDFTAVVPGHFKHARRGITDF